MPKSPGIAPLGYGVGQWKINILIRDNYFYMMRDDIEWVISKIIYYSNVYLIK